MSLLQGSFAKETCNFKAKETYNFKESTNRSHATHILVLKSCSASQEVTYIKVYVVCLFDRSLLQVSFQNLSTL